ncbi:MAG: S8 family serine peptidase [Deferribacteraceae bacterium]|jgi:subtilisin family serine protease|nr:S8 family serine peptidase [Deferribacteraceae bacterium]
MRALFFAVILIFSLCTFGYSAETGRYLVPVKKSDLNPSREHVCVLEQCYYIVDKISAERSVMSGETEVYYPVVERKFHAAPNDSYYSYQWHLSNSTINWLSGWEKIKNFSSSSNSYSNIPIVAVIDTGIVDHEDLPTSALYGGQPYESLHANPDTYGVDENGHGAHVAGIIGALTNNNRGVASAAGGKVRIMSIRVSAPCSKPGEEGCLSTLGILEAIEMILNEKVNNNAPIVAVNMSYGSPEGSSSDSDPEYKAIKQLRDHGIIAVTSAGNSKLNLDANNSYPAEYDLDNIVAVAAVGRTLQIASYSNYGSSVDIAAPGGDGDGDDCGSLMTTKILSLYIESGNRKYICMNGTSMASPYIAGAIGAAAALYNRDQPSYPGTISYPDITYRQLIDILYGTARTRNFGAKYINGDRLIDVGAFFQRVEDCREESKNTLLPCTLADLPPAPPPAPPAPPPYDDGGWDKSSSGGCSISPQDNGAAASLLLFLAIPLFIALRRRV